MDVMVLCSGLCNLKTCSSWLTADDLLFGSISVLNLVRLVLWWMSMYDVLRRSSRLMRLCMLFRSVRMLMMGPISCVL